jgi:hypothetical protein
MQEIEYDIQPERVGHADVTRYIDTKINSLREMVRSRPLPPLTDLLTSRQVRKWVLKFCMLYGKVLGAIEFAANFRHITHEEARQMTTGIQSLLNFHSGSVILGR